ncbi:MAG: hypothetical protein ACM3VS_15850, partial [Candidatus Dadabacteria bacterium]
MRPNSTQFTRTHSFAFLRTTLLFILAGLLIISTKAQSQSITLPTGSFIVDMSAHALEKGSAGGLKQYGLVYDLIKNYNVPVYWVIGQGKQKDGVDFSYNGVDYKGGTFVIDKKYITSTADSIITVWRKTSVTGGKGLVQGVYTTSSLPLNVTYILKAVPTWTLDDQNGVIAQGFFANAGIPATAYNWQKPSLLSSCNDIFVMPHADPTWTEHGNLYNWNKTYKGSIWLGCHAGSALANLYNPADTSQQMNFLMTKTNTAGTGIILPIPGSNPATVHYSQNSLILWGNHADASDPYNTNTGSVPNGTLAGPSDPVSQFLGVPDAAMINGSEQVYLPVKGLQWLPTTKIITYDPTQADVPTKSDGTAVLIAYGRAFGDEGRGYVMYEAGHDLDKGTANDAAAQRAFFNWSYVAMLDKLPVIKKVNGIPTGIIQSGASFDLSVDYTNLTPPFTVSWSSVKVSDGTQYGTFTVNNSEAAVNTTFQAPGGNLQDVYCNIKVVIKDACGRETFDAFYVNISRVNADLSISKTDGKDTYTPGVINTYKVVATNLGPNDAIGAVINDNLPTGTTSSWTAIGSSGTVFTASGSGSINQTVNIPSGGTITYTINLDVPSSFTGDLVNTVTITAPSGVLDPNTTNNSSTDTDTQNSVADLSITKDDNTNTYTPGTTTTYTILASNIGPSNVTGAKILDQLPTGTTWSWTASATGGATGFAPSGTGNIDATVDMPSGSSITYSVVLSIPIDFTCNTQPNINNSITLLGSGPTNNNSAPELCYLTNIVTITPPVGVNDNNSGNNTATDTDALTPAPSWTITKTAAEPNYAAIGTILHYTLQLKNTGNVYISGITITDIGADAGSIVYQSGDANNNSWLDINETWTYKAQHTITLQDLNAGAYTNTATAHGTPSGGTLNDTYGSALVPATQSPHWMLTKTVAPATYSTVGTDLVYTLTLVNDGNVSISGVQVSDPAADAAPVYQSGDANSNTILDPGETWTYSAHHIVTQADLNAGKYTNAAKANGTPAGGTLDPATASVTANATQSPHWMLTKTVAPATYSTVGTDLVYTLTLV